MKVLNVFILIVVLSILKVVVVSTSCDLECLNDGICEQKKLNETHLIRWCQCQPGYIGKKCERLENPCDSNPCNSNSKCVQTLDNDLTSYKCECKVGYTGHLCETNINDCLNSTCYNGGSCVDDINSFKCVCKWPYFGRYCLYKYKCLFKNACKNNGKCIQYANEIKCVCPTGYQGDDCSIRNDICLSQPCVNDGVCTPLSNNNYKCVCTENYLGKNCEYENVCMTKKPCKNNSTCVSLIENNHENTNWQVLVKKKRNTADEDSYYCECNNKQFTGINCDIRVQPTTCTGSNCKLNDALILNTYNNKLEQFNTKLNSLLNLLQTTTTTTSTPTTTHEETVNISNNTTNGSFVLVVNIEPKEFQSRKNEIIKEFEKKFGILMLIKKETTGNEMVYSYKPNNSKNTWTKIYFIIIFACLVRSPNDNNNTICLQNNIDDLNDGFQVLNELKKSSNLLPNYVSNISYEAYNKNDKTNDSNQMSTVNAPVALVVCAIVIFIIGSSFSLTVLLRQNAVKKVKAPIWFPPPNDSTPPTKIEYEYSQHQPEPIYEKISKDIKVGKSTKWSFNKAFDDFTHLFHKPSNKLGEISPSSSTSSNSTEFSTDDSLNPPVKMRKLDLSSAMPIQQVNRPDSPECYPSPPESLPDHSFNSNQLILNPINFKGGSFNITPLMMFIMGRSKAKSNKQFQRGHLNETNIIETFITNGADLNSKNSDGETALHIAARCGLYDIVKALLNSNADLNLYDNSGRNILHTAVSSNEYEIVKLILNHCAVQSAYNQDNLTSQDNLVLDEKYDLIDSKTIDDLGDTPLIIAARLNYNSIIQLLIEFNASVNATDNEGRSALHWCSKVNNLNGALLLIQSGANVNMQDNDEKTPLSSALNELLTLDTADLLIKFDAFISSDDDLKYTKMKSIMDSLQTNKQHQTSVNNINVDQIKNDLINKIKQEPSQLMKSSRQPVVNIMSNNKETNIQRSTTSKLTGASTKRKLSDTVNNQTDSIKLDKNKVKKTVVESVQHGTNVSVGMTYTPLTPSPPVNHQFQRNSYQSTSFMYPNQYYYSGQSQQQQTFSDYNFNSHQQQLTHNYLNDNKFYDYNQQHQQQQQLNSNSSNSINQNYNLFNSNFNENYAAYF